jgi:hypothetical protein
MQRRAAEVSSRRKELQHKRTSLDQERIALARDNQLRRRAHDFAARIHAVIDTLGDTQKQQLLRLLIEDVRGELSGASGKRTFARFACTGTPARLSPLDVGQGRRLLEV